MTAPLLKAYHVTDALGRGSTSCPSTTARDQRFPLVLEIRMDSKGENGIGVVATETTPQFIPF